LKPRPTVSGGAVGHKEAGSGDGFSALLPFGATRFAVAPYVASCRVERGTRFRRLLAGAARYRKVRLRDGSPPSCRVEHRSCFRKRPAGAREGSRASVVGTWMCLRPTPGNSEKRRGCRGIGADFFGYFLWPFKESNSPRHESVDIGSALVAR